jgi:hypothetical protein
MGNDRNKILLHLKNNKNSYYPGETLRGSIEWDFIDDVPEISIQVFWYTKGRGEQEAETVKSETISRPLKSGKQDFSMELPHAPYSYKGQISGVDWAVKASAMKDKVNAIQEIIIAPAGIPIKLTQVPDAVSNLPKFLQKFKKTTEE